MENLNRAVYAVVLLVLFVALPSIAPELSGALDGAFAEPIELISNMFAGINQLVNQFDGDLYALIINAGVSAPLTFAIVAALKKLPPLKEQSSQRMATIVGLLLYGGMVFATEFEQIVAYDNFVQIALLVLSMVVGTGATQFGASTIHEKLVDTSFAMAQPRLADSPSDSGQGLPDGQNTSA